jgi:mannitol operon transcriptional antiterminator
MNLSKRSVKILIMLRNTDNFLNIRKLAEDFSVSVRTIQKSLDEIDYFMSYSSFPPLIRVRNSGIKLGFTKNEIFRLDQLISNLTTYQMLLNNNERPEALLRILSVQKGYIKIQELSDLLNVSKSTVINDLNVIRQQIVENGIQIVSNSRYGIKLQGNEGIIRNYLLSILTNRKDVDVIYDLEKYKLECFSNKYFMTRKIIDIEFIYNLINSPEIKIDKKLSDKSFFDFVSSVELCLARIEIKKYITMDKLKLESLYGLQEFKEMCILARKLENHFGVHFPNEEIGYLTIQLLGSKHIQAETLLDVVNYAEIQIIVCDLINRVGQELRKDFSKNMRLYNDLIYHIQPAIYRMRNHITQTNPLIEDIKLNYSDIFKSVKKNITEIRYFEELELSEHEIGFITIHFASASIKDNSIRYKRPQVLIVCNSGIGTSNLLSTKLIDIYEMKIIGVVALHEMQRILETKPVDYIVTTIDLGNQNIETIKVNPLINEKDIKILDKFFDHKHDDLIDLKKLVEIIERHCVIKDKNSLISDLDNEFTLIKNENYERTNLPMLCDVITREMIELDFNASDWEVAVRKAGELLELGNCIDKIYIDSMVEVVKSIGAYIVIGKGIALPHSRSSDGVKKIGISLLRLQVPVVFGHPENDPVDLVFALSAVDNVSHMIVLSDLAKLLNVEENIAVIRAATCPEEILKLINHN